MVGKPNVGKSTFFAAATLAKVDIANYPFTTRRANIGIAYVRIPCVCRELGVEDSPRNSFCIDGIRYAPIKIVDCPGLVPGAWQGRGLGNQFLDEIRQADVLIHIVDASGGTDEEGRPVPPGTHDPANDHQFIEDEIDHWVLSLISRKWSALARRVTHGGAKLVDELYKQLSGLGIRRSTIAQALRDMQLSDTPPTKWKSDDLERFVKHLRRLAKPFVIAANKADLPNTEQNIECLRQLGVPVIPCSAEAELALRRAAKAGLIRYRPGDPDFDVLSPSLTDAQRHALDLIRRNVLQRWGSTGVQQALDYAYLDLLGMIAVFPVEDESKLTDHQGNVLPDVYLVPKGTTARELAALIHTELAESFIYAVEVRSGRRVGADYVLQHRDVIKIYAAKRRA